MNADETKALRDLAASWRAKQHPEFTRGCVEAFGDAADELTALLDAGAGSGA